MQRQVHPVCPNSGKVWKVFDLIWRISVQYQYIISISTGSHVEWYFRPCVLRRRRGESIGNPLISDRCLLYWFPMVSCIRLARTIVSPAFGFFPGRRSVESVAAGKVAVAGATEREETEEDRLFSTPSREAHSATRGWEVIMICIICIIYSYIIYKYKYNIYIYNI